MKRKLYYPTPQNVLRELGDDPGRPKGRMEAVVMFDSMAELVQEAEEYSSSSRTIARQLLSGYEGKFVHTAEKFLSEFESENIETVGAKWQDDVTGAVPNIPAYLAGVPLTMRNKRRDKHNRAPIAIVFDAFPSDGIKGEQAARIGAAIFALARILSTTRPVELWAGASWGYRPEGKGDGGSWMLTRVDTNPLNLAQASYVLCEVEYGRSLGFDCIKINHGEKDCHNGSGWPYRDMKMTRDHMAKALAPVFDLPEDATVLAIPAIGWGLPHTDDPVKWLRAELAKHVMSDVEKEGWDE